MCWCKDWTDCWCLVNSEYDIVSSTVSEYETTSNYDQELKYLYKKKGIEQKKKGNSYKQLQLLFPFNFKKICHMTYKKQNKNKHVQSMAYSSLWSDGPADDHISTAATLSFCRLFLL